MQQVQNFAYDLRPIIAEAHARIAKPDRSAARRRARLRRAEACSASRPARPCSPTASRRISAIVVAPSVTLPCTDRDRAAALPPLANVATLPTGPFTVSIPDRRALRRAAEGDGARLHRRQALLLQGVPAALHGEARGLRREGSARPQAAHQRARSTSTASTPTSTATSSWSATRRWSTTRSACPTSSRPSRPRASCCRLKAALDGNSIRDQARDALHLDIGERLAEVRDKLSTDLAFGDNQGCLRAHGLEDRGDRRAHAPGLPARLRRAHRPGLACTCPARRNVSAR